VSGGGDKAGRKLTCDKAGSGWKVNGSSRAKRGDLMNGLACFGKRTGTNPGKADGDDGRKWTGLLRRFTPRNDGTVGDAMTGRAGRNDGAAGRKGGAGGTRTCDKAGSGWKGMGHRERSAAIS
jgi:hypothetical protein